MKEKTRQIKFRKTLRKLINRPFHWEQTKKQEEYNMTLQLLVLLSHARVAFKNKGNDRRSILHLEWTRPQLLSFSNTVSKAIKLPLEVLFFSSTISASALCNSAFILCTLSSFL